MGFGFTTERRFRDSPKSKEPATILETTGVRLMSTQRETAFDKSYNPESGPRQSTVGQLFLRDLERLWTELLRMSAVVENALRHSVDVMVNQRTDLAKDVIDDERLVDRWEIRIEEKCLTILALHQPVASDLRRVAAVLKLNSLMERLSDLASHIAVRARKWNDSVHRPMLGPEFEELALSSLALLSDSLDALTRHDAVAAREILQGSRYATIDRLRNSVRKQMKLAIRENIENFDSALRVINIVRNFKRVSEHALEIAVEVVYLKEGVILRHQGQREMTSDDVD